MSNGDVTTTPNDRQKNRTRSPSYPSIGLEEAIRKVQALYDQEDRHPISIEAVASHWGLALSSSAVLQTVSALKQFGLLVDEGKGGNRRVRLSDLAFDILLREEDSTERVEAIKTAALNPKIHRELWDKYDGKLPPSDASIRVYLLRERPETVFNKDVVDGFINQFRSTLAFAKVGQSDTMKTVASDKNASGQTDMNTNRPSVSPQTAAQNPTPAAPQASCYSPPPPGSGMRELPITLPSLQIAVLRLQVPMSEKDFEAPVNSLTSFKESLVAASDHSRSVDSATVTKHP